MEIQPQAQLSCRDIHFAFNHFPPATQAQGLPEKKICIHKGGMLPEPSCANQRVVLQEVTTLAEVGPNAFALLFQRLGQRYFAGVRVGIRLLENTHHEFRECLGFGQGFFTGLTLGEQLCKGLLAFLAIRNGLGKQGLRPCGSLMFAERTKIMLQDLIYMRKRIDDIAGQKP